MQCRNPMVGLPAHPDPLPCGRCVECRIRRSDEWTTRLLHEMTYHPRGCSFITLTYSEDTLPLYGSLDPKQLQNYWKKLRQELTPRNITFKYYACGEYGENTGRPHYHAIILGLSIVKDAKIITDKWPFGLVDMGTVTRKSISYVTDYIKKSITGDLQKDAYQSINLIPPYSTQSQGLGLRWAQANAKKIERDLSISRDGQERSIPRYYCKKLGLDPEVLQTHAAERELERLAKGGNRSIQERNEWLASLRDGERTNAIQRELESQRDNQKREQHELDAKLEHSKNKRNDF